MINFDNLKMVLYDFDDTLCIHENHYRDTDESIYSHNIDVLKNGADSWHTCSINNHMKEFMELCREQGLRQGLISATPNLHSAAKCEWVKQHYGIELENFCVSRAAEKVPTMRALSDVYGYQHYQMMIVDDFYEVTEAAGSAGFKACTPMQIVNYIEQLRVEAHNGEGI